MTEEERLAAEGHVARPRGKLKIFLGEPRVNVLKLNRVLDGIAAARH